MVIVALLCGFVDAGIVIKRASKSSSVGAHSRCAARDLASNVRRLECNGYMNMTHEDTHTCKYTRHFVVLFFCNER